MDGHVDESVKKERIVRLVDLQNSINRKIASTYLNKTLEILTDEFNLEQQIYIGRDEGGKVVHFNSDRNVVGEFLKIKITKASGISLYGEIV